jgi:hypothetical protein
MTDNKTFMGMKYLFSKCERPRLFKYGGCLDCSVRQFCEAPVKTLKQFNHREIKEE